jgi:hypothetical protein
MLGRREELATADVRWAFRRPIRGSKFGSGPRTSDGRFGGPFAVRSLTRDRERLMGLLAAHWRLANVGRTRSPPQPPHGPRGVTCGDAGTPMDRAPRLSSPGAGAGGEPRPTGRRSTGISARRPRALSLGVRELPNRASRRGNQPKEVEQTVGGRGYHGARKELGISFRPFRAENPKDEP